MFKYNLWESQANIKYEINEMKFQNFLIFRIWISKPKKNSKKKK